MKQQIIKKYKQRNNIIVVILGATILSVIFFGVLFPVFKINDTLKDDFALRTINGLRYLELKIKGGHSFHKVSFSFNSKNSNQDNLLGKVYQDELGLYGLGEVIYSKAQLDTFLKIKNEKSNIQNGELIQKGNNVYFISEGSYRAFANAEVFDRLGFDWNKVQKNKGDLLANLVKGPIIDKTASYLSSSFVEVGDKLYLIDSETKYLIDNNDLKKYVKDKFSVIKVGKQKLQMVGEMTCNKKWNNKVICRFEDKLKKTLPQATVFVGIKKDLPKKWSAKITTFDGFESLTPKRSLSNIKRNLILKYDQRFGIGERVNK